MSNDDVKVHVDIHNLRKPYHNDEEPYLLEKNMKSDPFVQFDAWFKNLAQHNLKYEEVNAVALSTCCDNKPSSRMVLLKEFSSDGFTFFTNSVSRKAQEFLSNPNASLLFYWPIVNRQVRVEGEIKPLHPTIAEEYWQTRPLSSRIGSKLSAQSTAIPSRQFLEKKRIELEKLSTEQGEMAITRPESWLGYMLVPRHFEFWQGQSDRIHDRLVYERSTDDSNRWTMKRLAP